MKHFLFTLFAAAAVTLPTTVLSAPDNSVCLYKNSQCFPAVICEFVGGSSSTCRLKTNAAMLPQQIHLAFAGQPAGTGMAISWATFDLVSDSSVWIGKSPESLSKRSDVTVASSTYYSEGDYSLYQNHAIVSGLKPNTKYFYKVGSASDVSLISDVGSFTTARDASDDTPFEIAVYGDLGFGEKGETSTRFINTLGKQISFVYHIGDISYADDDFLDDTMKNGFFYEKVYNWWMNSMMPIMSQVPYMVTVGNHEAECHSPGSCTISEYKKTHLGNYTAYNARFKMPSAESGGALNMWYSFEYGPIHFTSISSETDYANAPSNEFMSGYHNGNFGNQLAWLEADLKKAVANRDKVPWIIVGMHRPIYDTDTCDENFRPRATSDFIQTAFEDLFIKYGVDVVFAGHEHAYQRHYPIANATAITKGVSSDKKTYANPRAPVYIVTGGPGNPEPNQWTGEAVPWNAMGAVEYGISTMRVTRRSLEFKYVTSTTGTSSTLDEFAILKGSLC